jgi:hypothetical protein
MRHQGQVAKQSISRVLEVVYPGMRRTHVPAHANGFGNPTFGPLASYRKAEDCRWGLAISKKIVTAHCREINPSWARVEPKLSIKVDTPFAILDGAIPFTSLRPSRSLWTSGSVAFDANYVLYRKVTEEHGQSNWRSLRHVTDRNILWTVNACEVRSCPLGKPNARTDRTFTRLQGIEISLLSSHKCNATI